MPRQRGLLIIADKNSASNEIELNTEITTKVVEAAADGSGLIITLKFSNASIEEIDPTTINDLKHVFVALNDNDNKVKGSLNLVTASLREVNKKPNVPLQNVNITFDLVAVDSGKVGGPGIN